MKTASIAIAALIFLGAHAQEPFTSPQARSAEARYRNAVRMAAESYIRELKSAQETAMRDRQLEEAARIKAAIERIKADLATAELAARGVEILVKSTSGTTNPQGTGIQLKAGQKFRMVPNPTDT